MPSSFRVARRIALPILAALGVAGFATHARAPVPRVRPAVALLLAIEGDYRNHMVDADCSRRCDSVLNAMYPVVRAALAAQYPFINWKTEPGALVGVTDTILIRWENVSEFFPGSQLKFVLREGDRVLDSVAVEFEDDTTISRRVESDWAVDALRKSWQGSLRNKLVGNDLLPRIFGRVSLNAGVDFSAQGDVFVPAHRDTLKAGAPNPVFEVGFRVNSTTLDVNDTGSVLLDGCGLAQLRRGYRCPLRALKAGSRDFTPAEIAELRRTRSVQWRATRLKSFNPDTTSMALRGLPQ